MVETLKFILKDYKGTVYTQITHENMLKPQIKCKPVKLTIRNIANCKEVCIGYKKRYT